jgi:aminoglycoside N3'-acetyltransferase
VAGERLFRQVYWSLPALRRWARRRRKHRARPAQVARREELKDYLLKIGVREAALVMVHTSVTGLTLGEGQAEDSRPNMLATAGRLVDDLVELVGPAGTLVLPAHPIYQATDDFFTRDERSPPLVYDPANTPCGIGLANEMFWRRPGVARSLHPYNALAARGPLAAELLRDNLNEFKPLPHGVHSGYYRFCQRNGLVVSIGVPLGSCLTVAHVPEDVLDDKWPVKDFFEDRRYVVRVGGADQIWTVRQVRREYGVFCHCGRKPGRDLRREGILHEGMVGSVRVDWARSGEVFEYVMSRCKTSPYPYYGLWLTRTRSS